MRSKAAFLFMAFSFFSFHPAFAVGWTQQTSHTTQALYGVASIDPDTWVAVGDLGTIVRSTDGGVTWSSVSSPVGDQLRAVSFNGSVGLAVGIAGRVLRSTDAGATWVESARPTRKALYSVSFGTNMAVITGEEGGIFVSTDGGLTWTQHGAGTASVLFGVSVSGNTAVGVGGQATVVMSVDGGAGWGLTILGDPTQLFFYGTSLANPSTGWGVGSYTPTGSIIIRTDDSGFVWSAQTAPTTSILFGVSFPSIDVGTAVGASGAIVHTTDGGQLWSNQDSGVAQTLSAVSFATSDLGIAVGDQGTILRTTTGGTAAVGDPALDGQSARLSLEQNSPNPFSPETTIRFTLARPGPASLRVYNLAGEAVAVLVDGEMKSGVHAVSWNGSGMPRGVYFARLETAGTVRTRKMIMK